MEVQLSEDLQSKLLRLAEEQGTNSQALVREAVERLVDHNEWFRSEVLQGLAQMERGETTSHQDVGRRLDAYLADKRRRA